MAMPLKRHVKDALAGVTSRLLPSGLMRDKQYFDLWQERGFHVTVNHFYEPVPDTRDLPPGTFGRERMPAGLDMNDAAQVALLEEFAAKYKTEYDSIPEHATGKTREFYLRNDAFEEVDAEILYSMVRHLRPERVIEIGSGFSTLLMEQAIDRNRAEGSAPCRLTTIDPFPAPILRDDPAITELLAQPVQTVDLRLFETLRKNDILFIDSSHVLKIGSDVQREILEILPAVRPGVFVHIHDIFIPREYPESWIRQNRWFWSEQYLFEAFLAFNKVFEVVWAGRYMHLRHADALRRAFRSYRPRRGSLSEGAERQWPASFWIRRVS